MTLIGLVCLLLFVGILLYGLKRLPMVDPTVKQFIYVLVIVTLALWLLSSFAGGTAGWNPRLW